MRQHSSTIRPRPSAFSLVELSIVLVILGLLVGGILSGQALIRAAELRSVVSDMNRYQAAVQSFRDKYFGLPGDITNATQFWGADTASSCTNAPVAGDRVAKTATCDGNGNGQVDGGTPEMFRIWQQLANAGLIEGSYTGVAGTFSTSDSDAGINSPKLRLGTSNGVSFYSWGTVLAGDAGNPWLFEGTYGNTFLFGFCGGYDCIEGFLKPEEAWNIDTKIDDGKPGTGKVVSRVSGAVPGGQPNCNTSISNAAGQATAATYMLTDTGLDCGLYFRGT
jgi:prepilin-type N-terminal cleavage/methylation domain-containing protein